MTQPQQTKARTAGWKRGLPPGKYYEEMVRDYEVYFSPIGAKWHRKRTPEQLAEYDAARSALLLANPKPSGAET